MPIRDNHRRMGKLRRSVSQASDGLRLLALGPTIYDPPLARVAELVRRDRLKPDCPVRACGFESHPGHLM